MMTTTWWGLSAAIIVAMVSGCSGGVVIRNAVDDATLSKTLSTQQIVGLHDAKEKSNAADECELELRLSTWDQLVQSDYVCIKRAQRSVAIPEHIALTSSTAAGEVNVDAARYCDPEFNKDGAGNVGTLGKPCVWNRKYYDRYPFEFSVRSPTKAPLSKFISLVRIIRNGRAVYTWTSTTASPTDTELRVPASSITSPEYFKDPVDIGLYILGSGVDEASKAVARTAEVSVGHWQETLKSALRAVASDATPPAVRQEMECAQAKVKHLIALANELRATDDAARDAYASEAKALNREIDTLSRVTASRSQAKPLEVFAAYDTRIDPKVPVPDGKIVAIYGRDGRTVILAKYSAKKPWSPLHSAELPKAGFAGTEFLFKVATGSRQGRIYAVQVDSSPAKVTPVDLSAQCTSVSDGLQKAHVQYIEATKALLGDGALRKVGAVAQQATLLSNQMGLSVTKLKEYVSAVVASLPQKELIDGAGLWLRTVDEAIADSMSAAQMLSTTGAEIEDAVKTTIRDPQAHLRAYETFAAKLPSEETLYTAPVRNIPPGDGESSLAMTYHRPRQSYYLLAWNAIPVPASSQSQVKVELRLENLIPIIDIVGWHWQGTWMRILSGAGVGVGLMGTRETVTPMGKDPYTTGLLLGPQVNLSAGGFRIGVSYLIHSEDGSTSKWYADGRNVRVLVGADLIRLYTGKDTAVVRSSESTAASARD